MDGGGWDCPRWRDLGFGLAVFILGVSIISGSPASAIDVDLTMDQAKEALAAGRVPMQKATSVEEVKVIMQQASTRTRVGADPKKDPCGASAVLRTKRFWLEAFGRKEATESKRQKKEIRMPDDKIKKYINMPNLEMEIQLCGDDEYFADRVEVALRQGSKRIQPLDVSPAQKGRKNEGKGPAYRTRFTALFAYDSFDPKAMTKVEVFFPDGRLDVFDADFSKIR
ncbi:MAG: hypothetical protein ACE5NA_03090 [Nitrospiraceae bacterium]